MSMKNIFGGKDWWHNFIPIYGNARMVGRTLKEGFREIKEVMAPNMPRAPKDPPPAPKAPEQSLQTLSSPDLTGGANLYQLGKGLEIFSTPLVNLPS